jgi:hypothetical protein
MLRARSRQWRNQLDDLAAAGNRTLVPALTPEFMLDRHTVTRTRHFMSKPTGDWPRVSSRTPQAVQLFGVTDADAVHAASAVSGTALVTFRDLAAVVAPAEYTRMTLSNSMLTEYIRVVDATYEHGPIIPAPPGTVFQSTDVLVHWMEVHYAKLHETLGSIERHGGTTPPYDYVRMQFED